MSTCYQHNWSQHRHRTIMYFTMFVDLHPRVLYVVYSLDSSNMLFGHQKTLLDALFEINSSAWVISIYDKQGDAKTIYPNSFIDWRPGKNLRNVFFFYLHFVHILLVFRPQKIFVHMADTHCALISPLAKLLKIPVYLWYAHKQMSISLRFSQLFVEKIFTSTRNSCPLNSNKVEVIGQAISEIDFSFHAREHPLKRGVYLGRFDSIKRLEHIASEMNVAFQMGLIDKFDFFGSPSNKVERKQFDALCVELSSRFPWFADSIRGPLQRSLIPKTFSNYDFLVNAYLGSLDKVLVEATMLGMPVITNNVEYESEFCDDPAFFRQSLLKQLIAYQQFEPQILNSILTQRRFIAITNHGVNQWTSKIAKILNEPV